MELKLNLVQETSNQILLQDVSDVSAGVSRVILDFVAPIKKRIELNGLTETKAYNFVNPLVNALLLLKDTDFEQSGFTPDVYELDYSIHYPYREELFVNVGQNTIYGIQMLTLLDDAEWLYFGGEYYQVLRKLSTQEYIFLDRPVTTAATTGELVYRDKIYLPLVKGLKDIVADRFRNLTGAKSSLIKLTDLTSSVFIMLGLVDNLRMGKVDVARSQMKNLKTLLQWAKQVTS